MRLFSCQTSNPNRYYCTYSKRIRVVSMYIARVFLLYSLRRLVERLKHQINIEKKKKKHTFVSSRVDPRTFHAVLKSIFALRRFESRAPVAVYGTSSVRLRSRRTSIAREKKKKINNEEKERKRI